MSKAEEYLTEKYQLSMKMNQFSPALVVKIMQDFADQEYQRRVNAVSDEDIEMELCNHVGSVTRDGRGEYCKKCGKIW